MSKTITLKPRLNEKTYGLAASRVYVFDVERAVNKHSIARAVEAQFEVKVTEVNTTNIPGKAKRVISINGKRQKNAEGSRNDFKKAYVTLAEGFGLPFFDAIEEEEQKEQAVQEKVDKAAAKQAEKTDKAAAKTAKKTKTPAAAAKPAKSAKAAEPTEEKATEEQPHRSAWRGFRLRKKSDDKKEDDK
jgi:large subunit ribosomal protein L23